MTVLTFKEILSTPPPPQKKKNRICIPDIQQFPLRPNLSSNKAKDIEVFLFESIKFFFSVGMNPQNIIIEIPPTEKIKFQIEKKTS